jgi:hypothetical protein
MYYCTYFDHRYLVRGLSLYWSLRRLCPSFQLWVLCLDEACYSALLRLDLPYINLIRLKDFERGDKELLDAKQDRTQIEYYFTCTPSLPLYILKHNAEVDLITYLDADLFFFADPKPIFDEIGDHSIAIIGHRFPPANVSFEMFGIYNVGFVSFRRDENGLACLRSWRDRCIEWCYDRIENGRFADQKYLDDWPSMFERVVVLNHKGANLAPWNIANYNISKKQNSVWIDDDPLIFFHFHGLKRVHDRLYDPGLSTYNVKPTKTILKEIFTPYMETISRVNRELLPIIPETVSGEPLRSRLIESTPEKLKSSTRKHDFTTRGIARALKRRLNMYLLSRRYFYEGEQVYLIGPVTRV